jgi:hypothetical protein
MRRIILLVAVAAVVAAGLGALASSASAAGSRATASAVVRGESAPAKPAVQPDAVTNGSTWTYYDFVNAPSVINCEILTFGVKTFSGDKGDQGTYKSSAKSTTVVFQNQKFFNSATFKGSLASGTGAYEGIITEKASKLGYGPEELFPGSNPRDVSGC